MRVLFGFFQLHLLLLGYLGQKHITSVVQLLSFLKRKRKLSLLSGNLANLSGSLTTSCKLVLDRLFRKSASNTSNNNRFSVGMFTNFRCNTVYISFFLAACFYAPIQFYMWFEMELVAKVLFLLVDCCSLLLKILKTLETVKLFLFL